MGFKVDASFLRFLTMGALGVRRVADELAERGFEPIELERYGRSNKIWSTKVKRLRLPDLLCVRTGLRVEVRAKSDLRIRMSDAPNNPERVWDAGMRDEDLVALIACIGGPNGPEPAAGGVYFSVRALRDSVNLSKLGPPKSASEGAERDRTWPSTVPSRPGYVLSVTPHKLVVRMEGDGKPARRQTYTLGAKRAYVAAGDRFAAQVTMLAGAPASLADIDRYLVNRYDPLAAIASEEAVDRYAAVKALRYRDDLRTAAVPALESALDTAQEVRVALEAAGSAAALGSHVGEERLVTLLWDQSSGIEMSMEAILILTELRTPFARDQLLQVASDPLFHHDERRQAAIWGLGKAGLRSYEDLVPFIGDEEEDVAFHAIAAFGSETPTPTIDRLVTLLLDGDPRTAPAASEALRVIGSPAVLEALYTALLAVGRRTDWVLVTLARLSPELVRERLRGTPLLQRLEPLLLIAPGANWLTTEEATTNMTFLLKQEL